MPEAAELPRLDATLARNLLDQMRDDPDLQAVARLARDLLAAIHWPCRLSEAQDLRVGGVSDISNRGSFDRLVTSELANDDLTLATRIALHEALYLRRDPPRDRVGGRRVVLIDCGIRMWGAPRVAAASVALALCAGAGPGTSVEAWRGRASEIVPVDLASRAGLVDLLSALEPEPHPAAAVRTLLTRAAALERPREIFVITHENVMRDPAFLSEIGAARSEGVNVISLSPDGRVAIDTLLAAATRRVHESVVDLSRLHVNRPARTASDTHPAIEPPAIFSVSSFPFRVSHVLPGKHASLTSHGLFALCSGNRMITLWETPGLGGRILAEIPHRNHVHLFEATENGVVHVVSGDTDGVSLQWFIYDRESGFSECRTLESRFGPVYGAFHHQGVLYLAIDDGCGREKIQAFSVFTGDEIPLPDEVNAGRPKWIAGRFIRVLGDWTALRFDGRSIQSEPIPIPAAQDPMDRALCVFDRPGFDGPWIIARSPFRAQCLATGETRFIPCEREIGSVRSIRVSRDGERALIDFTYRSRSDGEDLRVARTRRVAFFDGGGTIQLRDEGDPFFALEPSARRKDGWSRMLHAIKAIGVTAQGDLALTTDRAAWVADISTVSSPPGMPMFQVDRDKVARWTVFRKVEGRGWITHHAVAPDGTVALIDSRGMIHLREGSGAVPEVTFVPLRFQTCVVWSPDGLLHGPDFFLGLQLQPGTHANAAHKRLRDAVRGFA